MLEEAELFCQRHFPLPAKIVPTQMRRVETPLIPPDAIREILVNALIHRDYTIAGGAVSLAIFDDRVEVWSAGSFPREITPASLTQNHLSVQRNPMIADVFYRTGLIERWGRGTNRVVAMCSDAGIINPCISIRTSRQRWQHTGCREAERRRGRYEIAITLATIDSAPAFEEITGAAVVTFRVNVAGAAQVTPQVTPQVTAVLHAAARLPRSRDELQTSAGIKDREYFRKAYLEPLLSAGWLERTIPDKPRSRLQRYRTTAAGESALSETVKK